MCPTLCNPMDCGPPGSSVHGMLQARILDLGSHSLLQGIFWTQGLNWVHWRQILYYLSYQGIPWCFKIPPNFALDLGYWDPLIWPKETSPWLPTCLCVQSGCDRLMYMPQHQLGVILSWAVRRDPPCTPLASMFYSSFFLHIYFYLAALGLSCSMQDLVPWPGIEPGLSALRAQNPSHCITRQVPNLLLF